MTIPRISPIAQPVRQWTVACTADRHSDELGAASWACEWSIRVRMSPYPSAYPACSPIEDPVKPHANPYWNDLIGRARGAQAHDPVRARLPPFGRTARAGAIMRLHMRLGTKLSIVDDDLGADQMLNSRGRCTCTWASR